MKTQQAPIQILYRTEVAPPDQPGNYSKSPTKPRRFVEYLQNTPMWDHVVIDPDFAAIRRDQLLLAHQPAYVDGFLSGTAPLCESNGLRWTPELRDTVLWTNGALVAAVQRALQQPAAVVMAPVSGFHHAQPARGSGFCTFSGQVIAALEVYQQAGKRGIWFDLDGHFGNSIEDSRDFAPALNLAIPQWANINPSGSHQSYLDSLTRHVARAREALLAGEADYVAFAHGADSHEWDQLGHQCTTAEWLQAAELIYGMVAEVRQQRPVPLVLALFGGYRDDDPASVLALHAMDLAVCLRRVCGVALDWSAEVRRPGRVG